MPERDLFEPSQSGGPRQLRLVAPEGYRPLRADGQFACVICSAPASRGFGVNIRKGESGVWLCFLHWQAGVG